MKKKGLLFSITCVVAIMLIISCGGAEKNETKDGKKVVTVWAWDPQYNIIALNKAKEIYEKINTNVTIDVIEMAKADVEQKLIAILTSRQTDALPDIVLVEDYSVKKYLNAYPDAFVPYKNIDYSLFASPVDFMTIDGKVYGVPFGLATAGLFYRLDYIEESGFSEEDMQNITWDDIIDIGIAVKEHTGKPLFTFDINDLLYVRAALESAGRWYTDNNGSADIKDNEVIKEMFKTILKMKEVGILKDSTGWAEYVGSFNNGDVVGVLTGCWIIPSIKVAEDQSGKWRMAAMPKIANIEESVNASKVGGSSWFTLNGTGNEEVAQDFIEKTFATSVELYDSILQNNSITSMFIPAFSGDEYTKSQSFFGDQQIYKKLSEWSTQVKSISFGEYTYEADAVISRALAQVLNGEDIDKTLENAEQQFNLQIQ